MVGLQLSVENHVLEDQLLGQLQSANYELSVINNMGWRVISPSVTNLFLVVIPFKLDRVFGL